MIFYKRLLPFWMVIFLVFPTVVYAQTPDSTQPFTADDGRFSLYYPADWEIRDSGGEEIIFDAPIFGIGQEVQPPSEGMTVMFTVHSRGKNSKTAEALAREEAEAFAEPPIAPSPPQNLLLNTYPLAIVDVLGGILVTRHIVMDLQERNYVRVYLAGTLEQFFTATPLVLDILNTVRLADDTAPITPYMLSLPDSTAHARPNAWIVFEHPSDWQPEEMDTHTLLTAPNGVTVGISGEPLSPEIPDSPSVPRNRVEEVIGLVQRDIPNITASGVVDFTVQGFPAARVYMTDDTELAFGYIVRGLEDTVYANITVVGEPQAVLSIDPTVLAIVHSISLATTVQPETPDSVFTLTQQFTSSDGSLIFKYPGEWVTYDSDAVVVLSNNDGLIQSGDLNNLQTGDIVIFFIRDVSGLPEYALSALNDDPTPMEIVTALSAESEAAGIPITREKVVLGGHSSAVSYGSDEAFDLLDIAIQMENGSITTLLVFFTSGGLELYKDTVLAVADTVRLGD